MATVNEALNEALGQNRMTPALFRPPAEPKPSPVQQATEKLTGIEEKLGQAQQGVGEFEAKKAEFSATQKAAEAAKGAELVKAESAAISGSQAYKDLDQINREAAQARFEPSRRTMQENAALFGLISVIGFAIGAGGKSNAMSAMSAMNGMLEGARKGDMDRYNKEKDTFNTNLRALQQKSQLLATEVKRITDLAARDREQARLEFASLQAKEGADFVRQYADRFGLPATVKYLEQQAKGAERMLQMAQQADAREQARVQAEQARMDRERERLTVQRQLQEERLRSQRENTLLRLEVQKDLAKQRADAVVAKGEAKSKLDNKDIRQLEAYDSLAKGLEELKKTFKPEYASMGLLGFGADIQAEAMRRLGGKEAVDAMSWWSKYAQLQAPNRHALFGATLTGNELKNYQEYTAKRSDSPDFVLSSLDQQIQHSRGQGELKRDLFRGANKEVPEIKARDYFTSFAGPAQPVAAPAAAPAGGPKEGDKATSKSGKPMVYQDGKWVYE